MWWKRYEPLLEAKAQPVREVLIDLLAKELYEFVDAFPPEEGAFAWQDEALRKKFAGRLDALPKVDEQMAELLSRLWQMDLLHEVDAIDHLFRNELYKEACPTEAHVGALHLLWRAGVEYLLSRKEEAGTHLKRRDLVEAAAKFYEVFRKKRSPIAD